MPWSLLAEPHRLTSRVHAFCEELLALWSTTPAEMPHLGPRAGFRQQFSTARAAGRLIDDLEARIDRPPASAPERQAWRDALRARLQHFGQTRLGWPEGYHRLLFGDAFYDSSVAFARGARAFDSRLPIEQLWQALRNVWIGNSLQMLLDRPVELGPGLFAYSMLYPVTDNWLDDPNVPGAAKRGFNERLEHCLLGHPVRPTDEREAVVHRLVRRIEGQFPRDRFPSVYESLLAIHRAQCLSLQQHRGSLTDDEILRVSLEKGGSSVLADLYLVTGDATPDEQRFAFAYGVCLQLLDDLQDVEADLAAGHDTLFTRAARLGAIDTPTSRLARFIDTILWNHEPFSGPQFRDRLDLIQRNCRTLLVGSIAEAPALFSSGFRRHMAAQWPLSLRAQRRLRRRAVALWTRAASNWPDALATA